MMFMLEKVIRMSNESDPFDALKKSLPSGKQVVCILIDY